MNSELEKRLKRIQNSFTVINYEPKDRLEYLDLTFKARAILFNAAEFLNPLGDSTLSGRYSESDLKIIHGHFCESARCLLEMVQHFYEKVVEEADHNPFAT